MANGFQGIIVLGFGPSTLVRRTTPLLTPLAGFVGILAQVTPDLPEPLKKTIKHF